MHPDHLKCSKHLQLVAVTSTCKVLGLNMHTHPEMQQTLPAGCCHIIYTVLGLRTTNALARTTKSAARCHGAVDLVIHIGELAVTNGDDVLR